MQTKSAPQNTLRNFPLSIICSEIAENMLSALSKYVFLGIFMRFFSFTTEAASVMVSLNETTGKQCNVAWASRRSWASFDFAFDARGMFEFVFLKKRILNWIDVAFKRNDNRAGITEYVTAL